MNAQEMLEEAIFLATHAHKGQLDKSDAPYILHPLRVMNMVDGYVLKTIAVLHDIIEDTHITTKHLLSIGFSHEIVEAVDVLTRQRTERGHFENYDEYIARVKTNPMAVIVKKADIDDNLSKERLGKLDGKTVERLISKYAKAYRLLTT